jgi:hypothetical protein
LERFAREANITPDWIWRPLAEVCGADEVEWVRQFHFHTGSRTFGLVYVGWTSDPPVEDRMAAIAGALIRNSVNARVMMVHDLIDAAAKGAVPDISCLLIPNFFIGKAQGGDMPSWRVSFLLEVLLQRHAIGVQTVLYSSDLDTMSIEYGAALTRHIKHHYVRREV